MMARCHMRRNCPGQRSEKGEDLAVSERRVGFWRPSNVAVRAQFRKLVLFILIFRRAGN